MYIAIQSCPGIPAWRFTFVFQADCQFVFLSRFQIRSGIHIKWIIAIRPVSCLLSVDIYTGMTHGTVKYQCSFLAFLKRRSIKIETIPPCSHKRKPAGTSGMFHCFCLSVLGNCHLLLIIIYTEWPVDSPVVRDGDILPLGIIKSGLRKVCIVFTSELPPFFKGLLGSYLRLHESKGTDSSQCST